MQVSTNRYSHIDMARGIAMALVVAGHSCSSTTGDLNRMILSFHMPLFFFLSGIFAKQYTWKTIGEGVKQKTLRILLPQLLLAVLVLVMKITPLLYKGESLDGFNWFIGLGYWFLPTLFFCSLVYMLLTCCVDITRLRTQLFLLAGTFFVIFLTLYVFKIPNGFFSKYLKMVPVAFHFYILGNVCKKQTLDINSNNNSFTEVSLLLAAPLLYIVSQWNSPVKMYLNDYGSLPLFFITSFLGIFVVIEIVKRVRTVGVLKEIGQLSIAVYVWNFLIVDLTKGVLFRVLKMANLYTSGTLAALTFIISMVLLYFVSKLTMRYFSWLYGVKEIR